VRESRNTSTIGQEYLDVDGGTDLVSILEGWFWKRAKASGGKEASSTSSV
jgi:hypothetical protein